MAGFVIDPSEDDGVQQRAARPKMTAGERTLWAAAFKYKTSSRGTSGIEVMYVCVEGDESRAYVWDTFWMTQGAAFRLKNYSRAVGKNTPWHPDVQEEAADVILKQPVCANIIMKEQDDGSHRPEILGWSQYVGDITEEMESIVGDAEAHWRKMNPDNALSGGSSGYDDDEIPF